MTRALVDLLVATITIPGLEKAIKDKRGNLAAVGRHFGVSRQYISKRVKDSAKLKKAWDEARETMLDNAETELYEQALDGNTSALIFYMKTQGKRRGYVERQEFTGKDGDDLTINFVWKDSGIDNGLG